MPEQPAHRGIHQKNEQEDAHERLGHRQEFSQRVNRNDISVTDRHQRDHGIVKVVKKTFRIDVQDSVEPVEEPVKKTVDHEHVENGEQNRHKMPPRPLLLRNAGGKQPEAKQERHRIEGDDLQDAQTAHRDQDPAGGNPPCRKEQEAEDQEGRGEQVGLEVPDSQALAGDPEGPEGEEQGQTDDAGEQRLQDPQDEGVMLPGTLQDLF